MSDKLGTYTFLPWLRHGIANQVTAADLDETIAERVTVDVALRITGVPVSGETALEQNILKKVPLYGPGDLDGIVKKEVIKHEPRDWITNFEANYLPYIEFYNEDFPWRYTPSAPLAANRSRLRPWIMLVVLAEGEFTEKRNVSGRPLPFIEVTDMSLFPPASDLWAWAHVHVNRSLIDDPTDMLLAESDNATALTRFAAVLGENPDLAYSRIVSPRRLAPQTAYHAFLMPVFETGRLAGLGLDPSTAPFATFSAWEAYSTGTRLEPNHYPFYFRWTFRTSTSGDFEYLVRLLEPKPMDSRVGRRDLDVQKPGSNLPGITDAELGGVLKLGGALQIPFDTLKPDAKAEVTKYENWDQPYPHLFQRRLAELINLPDDYAATSVAVVHTASDLPEEVREDPNPDPLITAPLYGRWHALTQRLLVDRDGNDLPQRDHWVHELNLDPRFRVAAGFGTGVVQENQETYMESAWEQVGDVLAANQRIRFAQLARETSWTWYDKHLRSLEAASADRFLAVTAPLDKRVMASPVTRYFAHQTSRVPRVVLSAPMRRMMRPRGALIKRLDFPAELRPDTLVSRLDAGEIVPAPPKVTPEVLPTPDQLADTIEPGGVDGALLRPEVRLVLILVFLLLLLLLVLAAALGALAGLTAAVLGAVLVGVAVVVFRRFTAAREQQTAADSLREENQIPAAVDELPTSPDFVLTRPGDAFTPRPGASDSAEAERFKIALRDVYTVVSASREVSREELRRPLDVVSVAASTFAALDPQETIKRRVLLQIFIPDYIRERLRETFVEAMAYPEFDIPMYKPLVEISSELFLPNIQYVEQNSISLLETNQRFIESYMVGLNHEFARELLWREYPTDQRGSSFRQFWDPSTFLARAGVDAETLKENLRDIPPLHRWSRFSKLGDHDNRELPGDNEEELVLVIRGELLKKYPTAVIFAHRARWQRKDDGSIDRSLPRQMVPLTAAEEDDPPYDKVRTPLYEAKVEPDITFFGFDLTALEARGESEAEPDDPGWFFVIKERPGEPRFGLDVDQDGTPGGVKHSWNDVSWEDVMPGGAPGSFLTPSTPPAITLTTPPASATEALKKQHEEDRQIAWDAAVSAAEMAYILYQVPVLVAVHASEMLPS